MGEVLGFMVFTSVHIFCPFQLRNKCFVEDFMELLAVCKMKAEGPIKHF